MLDRAGFDVRNLETLLHTKRFAQLTERRALVLANRVGHDPLGILVRLFLLALPVEAAAATEAFAPVEISELESSGLLVRDDGNVRSLVRLTPFEDLVITSDQDPRGPMSRDYVPGLNNAAETLAALLVRRPCRRALDLGTGCGIQALIAARYSEQVVATDVNPRALAFGRLSAALNGVENIEWRQGSLFDPVRGERFDSLSCNAPFVVSPDDELAFRDSGMPRDSFCEQLVRGAAAHLSESGIAQLMVSWAVPVGSTWSATLESWVESSDTGAWLLLYDLTDPVRHAEMWTHEVSVDDLPGTLSRWLSHLQQEQIDRVGYGVVYLHQRDGETWRRTDELPPGPFRPATDHVLRVLANQDLFARHGDAALLQRPLRLADDAVLREWRQPGPEGWRSVRTLLYLTSGLRFRLELEPPLVDVLARLASVERADLHPDRLSMLRRLAELGFVEIC